MLMSSYLVRTVLLVCVSSVHLSESATAQDVSDSGKGQKLLFQSYEYCTGLHSKHSVMVRLRYYGPGGEKAALNQGPQLNRFEDRFFVHLSESPGGSTGATSFAYRERAANMLAPDVVNASGSLGELASMIKSGDFKELASRIGEAGLVQTKMSDLAAVHRNDWFVGSWMTGRLQNIQNVTDRMRSNEDFAKGVKFQIGKFQMESMALPLLTIYSVITNEVVFSRAEELFNARYFAFDYKQNDDVIAVWQRDAGVVRVRFGANVENLPVEIEYFSRKKELGKLKQGENPGILTYRTVTQWTEFENGKTVGKVASLAPYEITMERIPNGRSGVYNRLEAMFEWDFRFDPSIVTVETILNKPSKETSEPNPLMNLADGLTKRLDLRDAQLSSSGPK